MRCMKRAVTAFATALLLFPAKASTERINPGGCRIRDAALLELITLEKFPDGPCNTPTVFMARSPNEWKALMDEMEQRGELVLSPAPSPPLINWKRYGVIVVSLGALPTNGYGVEIRSVKRMARTALLDIEVTVPTSDLLPQVLTFPYHMVRVDKAGMNDVEICSRTFRYVGLEGRSHRELERYDEGNDLLIPTVGGEQATTWGGVKARFR
jgi:hypothetical protein